MKIKLTIQQVVVVLALAVFSPTSPLLFTADGQGSLTPPGAPTPTMKTLEQIEPRTPISSLPFTITSSGSYYVTTNLTGVVGQNGIQIDADQVTLDLSGFSLQGVPGSLDGINVIDRSPDHANITIRNGTLRGWDGDGLDAAFCYSGTVEKVKAFTNGVVGIRVDDEFVVQSCHAVGNGDDGILASDNCIISDCVAAFNGLEGIQLASASIVRNNVAQKNGGSGIRVGNDNIVTHNVSDDNDQDGIRLTSGDNRVDENHVTDNDFRGIAAIFSGALIIRNTAADNDTNYFFAANNRHGPIVNVQAVNGDISGTAGSSHPWANFEF